MSEWLRQMVINSYNPSVDALQGPMHTGKENQGDGIGSRKWRGAGDGCEG